MNTLAILCLLFLTLGLSQQTSQDDEWQAWKQTHQKSYSNYKEEMYRRKIWQKNMNDIHLHNNRIDKQYTLQMNRFGDQESMTRKKLIPQLQRPIALKQDNLVFSGDAAPTSFDWRTKGVIGAVSNQGQMGDVEAIVAAESVASLQAIKTGQLYNLSAEEIDDCGCGEQLLIKDIFGCIRSKIGGLCTTQTYKQNPTQICNKESCQAVGVVNGTNFIRHGDEVEMGKAILKSPLMVYVDASHPSFEMYSEGIYAENSCSQSRIDHVLQVVGYGQMDNKSYWICKNSWGETWGINGYIWIERGRNMCGIASLAIYPY
ncbi:uncharacterized protein LOC126824803 [Patella vulgata]|uniref:uncharacterized protein LOC126824803 n=1 Tax=Patella vulgata TaxID=6465 RepID=UPI0024A837F4|nr:uncharacterized protein LOC126824803 [Patella vulgata]